MQGLLATPISFESCVSIGAVLTYGKASVVLVGSNAMPTQHFCFSGRGHGMSDLYHRVGLAFGGGRGWCRRDKPWLVVRAFKIDDITRHVIMLCGGFTPIAIASAFFAVDGFRHIAQNG